ncbi:rhomboid family intramembrane serine protease [Peptococcaceae bacterium 1198_IL3148]
MIIINVYVFIQQVSLGPYMDEFIAKYAVVPYHLLNYYGPIETIAKLTTTMFLHGGWMHMLGNMLYLWIFGDNIEGRMGHVKYLVFYLITGYVATLTHVYLLPDSTVPMVGASGAIAGVLGGYFILFPRAKVLTLLPIFIFITFVRIPALLFLGLWFILQVLNQAMVSSPDAQSVAWWAHIGGFVAGAILIKFFSNKPQIKYY